MKATFEHQTWAPTELINDNTVTLNRLDELMEEKDLETNILQSMICTPLISQQIT